MERGSQVLEGLEPLSWKGLSPFLGAQWGCWGCQVQGYCGGGGGREGHNIGTLNIAVQYSTVLYMRVLSQYKETGGEVLALEQVLHHRGLEMAELGFTLTLYWITLHPNNTLLQYNKYNYRSGILTAHWWGFVYVFSILRNPQTRYYGGF